MRSIAIFGLVAVGLLLMLPVVATTAQLTRDAPLGDAPVIDVPLGAPFDTTSAAGPDVAAPEGEADQDGAAGEESGRLPVRGIVASLTIFVLAVFVGFEIITKVPPTLHTPLMSGSNAISGITIVGAVLVAGTAIAADASFFARVGPVVGAAAVVLATVNAVGGFLVTHRMLSMFQRKR